MQPFLVDHNHPSTHFWYTHITHAPNLSDCYSRKKALKIHPRLILPNLLSSYTFLPLTNLFCCVCIPCNRYHKWLLQLLYSKQYLESTTHVYPGLQIFEIKTLFLYLYHFTRIKSTITKRKEMACCEKFPQNIVITRYILPTILNHL